MSRVEKPKARQSQLVTTYGVGALFPAGDKSLMICGIDAWDDTWSPAVEEPRLARSLGVLSFKGPSTGKRAGDVPAVRFPEFHYCPECRRLAEFWRFDRVSLQCDACNRDLTPSRFVACCEDGHIEDFPYFLWLHRGQQTSATSSHQLRITTRGASSSLKDIVISCECGVQPYSLEGSFARFALREIKSCGGRRPWLLEADPEACGKPLRVLQRGSANVWFGAIRSAISIPPWSSPAAKFVTKHWALLAPLDQATLRGVLEQVVTVHDGVTVDLALEVVNERKGLQTGAQPTEYDLRADEYRALLAGHDSASRDSFQCYETDVDDSISGLVVQVSAVGRLREVRALEGFTRVTAIPTSSASPRLAKLSATAMTWLPATEVLGEGVFLRLGSAIVNAWATSDFAKERASRIERALQEQAAASDSPAPLDPPSAKFVVLHSLAHVLMTELSLDAGYPVGSLRERVYADDDQEGVLIYTASSDAAGSLGGLVALAQPVPLAVALRNALTHALWCSNDPVCAESGPSGADGLNLAACHACLLVPETSCEARNVYLDRLMLVGLQDQPELGLANAVERN